MRFAGLNAINVGQSQVDEDQIWFDFFVLFNTGKATLGFSADFPSARFYNGASKASRGF
jgi:hypothetical protein